MNTDVNLNVMRKNSLKTFKFRLNHDGGTSVISVPANSYYSARKRIKRAEAYPDISEEPLREAG